VTLTCPELTPANYTVWAIKVEAILDAQGVWEAVSPADGTMTVDEKKHKMARAQLLGALSEDILMQVSGKKTAKEVWESLKTRFVGADRVKAARLSTLRGEFDRLYMAEEERLDDYAGKISGMAARYASLGSTLSDADMVKKLLDTMPDRLYNAVAGIEQFCDPEKMAFEEALGRLKAFEECSRRHAQAQAGGERSDGQLLLTADEWRACDRNNASKKKSTFDIKKVRCYNCQEYGHFSRDCSEPRKERVHLAIANVDDEPALL
jgi:hypothetical protein